MYKGFCTLEEADRWMEMLQPNLQGEPNPALVGQVWKKKLDLSAEKRRKTLPDEAKTEYVVQKSKTPAKSKTRYDVNREKVLAYNKEYRRRNREKVLVQKKEYYRRNRKKILAKQRAVYCEKKRDADLS